MHKHIRLGALVCFALASVAAEAQDNASVSASEGSIYPEEPGGYGASAYKAQTAPAPSPLSLSLHQKYPFKADVNLEVPIPLTDEHDSADPGFGISGMFGWDLGFLLPTANIGWGWNGLNVPDQYGDDRSLSRFHMGFGLMAEFENRSIVTPVFGALLDLNWWHVSGDVNVACGGYYYWGCAAVDNYEYTTGFTFKAGADFRFLKNDRFTLGTGVFPSVTLSGGPFRDSEWWILALPHIHGASVAQESFAQRRKPVWFATAAAYAGKPLARLGRTAWCLDGLRTTHVLVFVRSHTAPSAQGSPREALE